MIDAAICTTPSSPSHRPPALSAKHDCSFRNALRFFSDYPQLSSLPDTRICACNLHRRLIRAPASSALRPVSSTPEQTGNIVVAPGCVLHPQHPPRRSQESSAIKLLSPSIQRLHLELFCGQLLLYLPVFLMPLHLLASIRSDSSNSNANSTGRRRTLLSHFLSPAPPHLSQLSKHPIIHCQFRRTSSPFSFRIFITQTCTHQTFWQSSGLSFSALAPRKSLAHPASIATFVLRVYRVLPRRPCPGIRLPLLFG
ncbi:uncharacterized protein SCHCODRAFT_02637281 [Schizophyllum commune H4-8]|uniref:uncharacterized protein n=1 Tax=Schizophyllum commune (strain H4-8 / FGSC 9210) TaxID=578458 RepID=UPI00215E4516|nr:uncharacterized protein SCHCODRAFT_02637281 [Schizophyllum commune H4-8]KAI5888636.1 hypothetical protein SCHCODRAFT_02637281 [Schizophyllum commune H4-8]